jgi:hypothetical protein
MYTFDEEEFISAMERAELVCKNENKEGVSLRDKFTYKNTLERILE